MGGWQRLGSVVGRTIGLMGEIKGKTKRRGEKEQLEVVEIEYIEVRNAEYERRIVALIQALLEIDRSRTQAENLGIETKEAA